MNGVCFVAISRFYLPLVFESISCSKDGQISDVDQRRYEHYAQYKLRQVLSDHDAQHGQNKSFHSCFGSQLGTWYIKALGGYVYMVVTTTDYPSDVAVEALDELSETFIAHISHPAHRRLRRPWWKNILRTNHHPGASCQEHVIETVPDASNNGAASDDTTSSNCPRSATAHAILLKYGTDIEGSAVHTITTQIDETIRREYSARIRRLLDCVDILQDQMHDNIQAALYKEEQLKRLEQLSGECLEQAKLFKKKAKKLSWSMWLKDKKGVVIGTTLCTAAGALTGFLLGGPAGAFALTSMESIAAAQLVEASTVAALFGGGFLGARSMASRWFWSQRFQML